VIDREVVMPRSYPPEFRREVCARLLAGEAVKDLAAELSLGLNTLYRWRTQALVDAGRRPGTKSFEADPLAAARRRVKELEDELRLVKLAARLYDEAQSDPKAGPGW
jgi:transposase